jgi:hypothetical protein
MCTGCSQALPTRAENGLFFYEFDESVQFREVGAWELRSGLAGPQSWQLDRS